MLELGLQLDCNVSNQSDKEDLGRLARRQCDICADTPAAMAAAAATGAAQRPAADLGCKSVGSEPKMCGFMVASTFCRYPEHDAQ
jgi:hypothetical protein